jgi:hypothetical protein
MNQAIQKRSGRDNNCFSPKLSPIFQHDAREFAVVNHKVDDFSLAKMKIGRGLERTAHLGAVSHPIRLRPWRLDCRSPGTIEQAKLNSGAIDNAAHYSAKRIDLPHEVSFRNSTDGGIAGHLPNEIEVQRDQSGFGAEARRSRRRFTARVAGADHDYIEYFIKRH